MYNIWYHIWYHVVQGSRCCHGTAFLLFMKSTSVFILNQPEYVLWVPDSIARQGLQGPAGKLASDSGTEPHIEANHTKALAGLFTAAWQHPCQCLGAWALALAACWGIQLRQQCCWSASPDSQPPWPAVFSPAAKAPASSCCKQACEGLGLQVGASMMSCKIFKQSC